MSETKKKNTTLREFISYALYGCITSLVDIGVFLLCRYLIFAPLASRPFEWWLISYDEASGGLCAFLSFAVSFAASQVFNFFIQRKRTFHADNNTLWSGAMYAVMVIVTYFFQLWLPTAIGGFVTGLVGERFAATVLKCINMTTAFLIQFPINKWVIMRKRTRRE